jgi:thioredoxin 1
MKLFAKTALITAFSFVASLAIAGEVKPFTQQDFDSLAQADKPVVLDITAPWCPTCKAQALIIEALIKNPAYKDVTMLTIDFDSSKPILKTFKVNQQSTLIAFKGGNEVARSTGDTTQAGLENIFKKTMN